MELDEQLGRNRVAAEAKARGVPLSRRNFDACFDT
jgi:hypothetical protein